jgi:hypothetical protein
MDHLPSNRHTARLIAFHEEKMHAAPRVMQSVPIIKIVWSPSRDVSFGSMALPIVLKVRLWIDHGDITGPIYRKIQQVRTF